MIVTAFDTNVLLSNNLVTASPLEQAHFDDLFAAANDVLIWEQHPNPNRYQLKEFTTYFEGAMQSKGAFLVQDCNTKQVIGCSRFYEGQFNSADIVMIGYTFFIRACWGLGYNQALKKLMLDYAFGFVDAVYFHVGEHNIRSQKAMERLAAIKVGVEPVAYHGEAIKNNILYCINKQGWLSAQAIKE
jgi:N-acetyltransferase